LTEIKQGIDHIRCNNHDFVQIIFGIFKDKLESKGVFHGIKYQLVGEAFTSQVESLALDPIEKHEYGRSRRVKEGCTRVL
jgi:putative transposase